MSIDRMKRVFLAGVFSLALTGVAGVAHASPDNPVIGVVVKIGGIPWFNAMEKGIKKKARSLATKAFMVGPTSADPALQVRAIEDLIAQKVNVIGVVPNDANVLEPVLRKRARRGHQGDHPRIARAEERRLGLRDGLRPGLWRGACQAVRRGAGRQGQICRLRRLADGAAAQPLGRRGHRLSQEDYRPTCRWSATATAWPKASTTATRRRSISARQSRSRRLPDLRQPGPDRRRASARRAAPRRQGRSSGRSRPARAGSSSSDGIIDGRLHVESRWKPARSS